jgi:DNA repair protein RadD
MWWRKRALPGTTVPQSIGEALEMAPTLDTPRQIAVRPNGRFTEVFGHRFFTRDVVQAAA